MTGFYVTQLAATRLRVALNETHKRSEVHCADVVLVTKTLSLIITQTALEPQFILIVVRRHN